MVSSSQSQVPLELHEVVKEFSEPIERLEDRPEVLLEYLFEDALRLEDDGSRTWVETNEKNKRSLRSIRLWWLQGRLHQQYLSLTGALHGDSGPRLISASEICERLDVSPQAVSQWTQGETVIAQENLELLRRYFRNLSPEQSEPSNHQLDCSGYRYAITALKRRAANDKTVDILDTRTFWVLWYLLRSTEWLMAETEADRVYVAMKIGESLNAKDLCQGESQLEAVFRKRPNVDELNQIVRQWGMTFCQVIVLLDDLCWTSPYV